MSIIQDLGSVSSIGGIQQSQKNSLTSSFENVLGSAINDVNKLQTEASIAVEKFVSGEANSIHEVMIAVEKAKTSFELLMEVRNKALDMYRELMKVQI